MVGCAWIPGAGSGNAQLVAPGLTDVAQGAHAIVLTVLYCPPSHWTQLLAPAESRVLVADPAWQTVHCWYDTVVERPGGQAVHEVAPGWK
jgi:hypothetical protein